MTYVAELLSAKFGHHIFINQNIILTTKKAINNIRSFDIRPLFIHMQIFSRTNFTFNSEKCVENFTTNSNIAKITYKKVIIS